VVSIPDEVATLEAPSDGQAAKEGDGPKVSVSPIGSWIAFLVALAAACAIGYGVFLWMKKNPDTVKAKLEKLGVEIPEPNADDGTAPAPAPIAPKPVQKIILDDAAPRSASAAPTDPGNPKLVGGSVSFEIPEGTSTVGREVGLDISLHGESSVSRSHAELTRSGDSVKVKDLGSTNGTFINGVQVQGEAELKPGDTLQFGTVRFRYEV
jgi:hypothetical protein